MYEPRSFPFHALALVSGVLVLATFCGVVVLIYVVRTPAVLDEFILFRLPHLFFEDARVLILYPVLFLFGYSCVLPCVLLAFLLCIFSRSFSFSIFTMGFIRCFSG